MPQNDPLKILRQDVQDMKILTPSEIEKVFKDENYIHIRDLLISTHLELGKSIEIFIKIAPVNFIREWGKCVMHRYIQTCIINCGKDELENWGKCWLTSNGDPKLLNNEYYMNLRGNAISHERDSAVEILYIARLLETTNADFGENRFCTPLLFYRVAEYKARENIKPLDEHKLEAAILNEKIFQILDAVFAVCMYSDDKNNE